MTNNLKILVIAFIAVLISCRSVTRYESRAKIVGRTIDTTLNDSAIIYGTVSDAGPDGTCIPNSKIWIDNSAISTMSDDYGSFSLTVKPGTYTFKCLGAYTSAKFIATLKDVSLSANEKVEIKFLVGSISE